MYGIRKLLGFVMAAVLAAFPFPSMGDTPNKHYILNVAVGVPDSQNANTQADTPLIATIFNDNPSGSNAQFGSFTISLTDNESGLAIVGAGADANLGGTITPVPSPTAPTTSISVTGITPLKPGQTYTLTLHVQGCGDRNNWAAQVWSGSNLNGGLFTDGDNGVHPANVPCGLLACGDAVGGLTVSSFINTTILDPLDGRPRSRRGPFNEDGTCIDSVKYFVTELATAPTNPFLHFRWADNQRGAAFFYVLDQPLGPNAAFAWKADSSDDVTGNPIFVPALQCDQAGNARFPGSYGKLISDNGGKLIKVDTTTHVYTPPATPFRIALGPKPMEYLTVTKVSGQTWTVTRGAGAVAHLAHIDVMSTPAPALPNPVACYDSTGTQLGSCPTGTYVGGGPARMCYVPSTDTSNAYIFDIGDGYVRGSF